MSAMRQDCPLVIIRWEDSGQPLPSWQYLSALPQTRAIECATVGWLLKDGDDLKVICQSVGDLGSPKNAQASGIMTIPARCVLSIEKLIEEEITCSAYPEPAAPSAAAADLEIGSAPTRLVSESHPT
jgi:hypothetical protein